MNYIDIGSGTPVILLHGLGQYHKAWESQFDLADKYRLIIPDILGHGKSESPPNEPITLENMAKSIVELLDYLGIAKAYIVGLSLGGLIAQQMYKQNESLFLGLVLCNTTFYIPSFFANKLVNNVEKFLIENDKHELVKHMAESSIHNKKFLQEAIDSFQINDAYIECARSGIGVNYFSMLPSVRVPTLLIGGSHDSTTPVFNLFTMKWLMPRAKIKIFECGHLSNIEKKHEFNSEILHFLNENT